MSSHVVSRSEMDNDRPMCMMSGVGDEGGNNGQANLSGGGEMMRVMQHHEVGTYETMRHCSNSPAELCLPLLSLSDL